MTCVDFANDELPDDFSVEIHSEVFDKDFDDVGWEPEIIDDDIDEDFANMIGYK